jgi:CubicO group peptidase (beta-lactamase class C family)
MNARSPLSLFEHELFVPPGAAALVFGPSDIGTEWVGGHRASGDEAPVTQGYLWHWGSVGKPVTSSLIATLVADRVLLWDAPLLQLLPELRATAYEEITLRMLLGHRTGLPTDPSRLSLLRYLLFGGDPVLFGRRQMTKILAKPPAFPPGSDFLYSNVGYGLAGLAACRALGTDFAALLRDRILSPWNLAGVDFGIPPQDGTAPAEHVQRIGQRGWKVVRHGTRAVDDLSLLHPSGCLHGPVGALAAFGQRHLRIALGETGATAVSLAETHRPTGPPPEVGKDWTYGMGWFIGDVLQNGGTVLWHAGSTGGCFCLLVLVPEKASGLALVANGFDAGWARPDASVLHTAVRLAGSFGQMAAGR